MNEEGKDKHLNDRVQSSAYFIFNVDKFSYLGNMLLLDKWSAEEIAARIGKVQSNIADQKPV